MKKEKKKLLFYILLHKIKTPPPPPKSKQTNKRKNFNVGMHSDVNESICFKLGMMIDTTKLWYKYKWLWPWFKGHRSARKQNLLKPILSQSFQSTWMEFGTPLRLVGLMNFILILSRPFNFQGREPYLWVLCTKTTTTKLQTFTDWFHSKLVSW